ncbi:MAG TPA: MerR family transcriptional regulator [Planktothrix sp.]|jgi:DNA-binding transcriptional MerR regulator
MSRSPKVEGTKIAQAAKDLNVTSVTIRRYIQEFEIETTADENGIKVLPQQAMAELQEIRRLKEDGLTNPKVMEFLEDFRKRKPAEKAEPKAKGRKKAAEPTKARLEEREEEPEEAPAKQTKRPAARRVTKVEQEPEAPEETEEISEAAMAAPESEQSEDGEELGSGDGKSKHSLTCQTCSKVFEHMNPRLRDCLECYRAKRKERRRGGADRHKNVIQHPLAQQVANKAAQQNGERAPQLDRAPAAAPARERERSDRADRGDRPDRADRPDRGHDRDRDRDRETSFAPTPSAAPINVAPPPRPQGVRNYRKAIEETRQITGSLKRRLERPDLPEGERRWLEQIYAYQLILHQGWRHLAEYRAASQPVKTGGASGSHGQTSEE